MRIDKYLWAIRLFKTRSLATEACRTGRVKLNGTTTIKASHEVKPGEELAIQKGAEKKIIKVTALLPNRVEAKLAINFYEDRSPVPDPDDAFSIYHKPVFLRDKGSGRPTKKQRRDMTGLRDEED